MTSFGTKLRGNEKLAALTDKLQNGTATYADAYEYALEVGTDLSDVFAEELSSDVLPDGKMYFNIANRVVRDPLTRAYNLIADECEGVQTQLNTAAGIALKAQRPEYPESRIKGFIDRISSEPDYDKVSWILREPVKTYSQSVVDDSVKKNAEFHYKAGLSPRIIRSAAAHCCEWCNDVAGTYTYPNVPKDVYRRHNFCRCQVEYDPRTGRRQDVHTKRWSNQKDYVRYREIENQNRKEEILKTEVPKLSRIYVGQDKKTFEAMKNVKPIEGFEDFGFHGFPDRLIYTTNNGVDIDLDAKQIAEIIRNDPEYKGGDVRLLACQAGALDDGIAKQIANEMGKTILAPTEIISLKENGEMFISDNDILAEMWYSGIDVKETGYWKRFKPEKIND